MELYGIIGRPLVHSFSDAYFTKKFAVENIADAQYRKFEIAGIELLPKLLEKNPELRGFNVTIPYKQQIIPYLESMSDEARRIGAVNCVQVRDGRLIGHNTDYYGFRTSLLEFLGDKRPEALVLGTGGASKAVMTALNDLGIKFLNVSRTTGDITYDNLDAGTVANHKLIINTTPLGTFPNTDEAADIPYDCLTEEHFLYDLVYNPPMTKFMKLGQAHGASVCNGQKMFVLQAERSWQIFGSNQDTL